jgi:hypothetical protein
VFAGDGCVELGGYYRAGEAFVEFAYPRTDSPRETMRMGSPGVAPDVRLYVHACGGTRRVRAADGTPVRDVAPEGHEGYLTEIRRLLGRSR